MPSQTQSSIKETMMQGCPAVLFSFIMGLVITKMILNCKKYPQSLKFNEILPLVSLYLFLRPPGPANFDPWRPRPPSGHGGGDGG